MKVSDKQIKQSALAFYKRMQAVSDGTEEEKTKYLEHTIEYFRLGMAGKIPTTSMCFGWIICDLNLKEQLDMQHTAKLIPEALQEYLKKQSEENA